MMVTKVGTKTFVGKNIIHVSVFKKKIKEPYIITSTKMVKEALHIKRFSVTSITRDKLYDLTNGKSQTSVYIFLLT